MPHRTSKAPAPAAAARSSDRIARQFCTRTHSIPSLEWKDRRLPPPAIARETRLDRTQRQNRFRKLVIAETRTPEAVILADRTENVLASYWGTVACKGRACQV